jgi:hypothetical protein
MTLSDGKVFGKELKKQFLFDEKYSNLNHGKIEHCSLLGALNSLVLGER